jgi:hypothetical protein
MISRTKFQLTNGRSVRLTSIDQWGTYSGLLEGVPHREMNARTITRTLNNARERYHFEPHLIQPIETPIDLGREYPFGEPASIPAITCVAQFDCFETVADQSKHGSTLPIVWFQSEFAFPIAPEIVESITNLTWDKLATDYCH